MSTFQNPLRSYRESEKLTLEVLAARFGVNKTTILRWEEGRIPAERVLDIERLTGIRRGQLRPDLYPDDEDPALPPMPPSSLGAAAVEVA